jgi:predicted ATPase/class 3 adenylate cyclase/DNA-binding CsgD family transcriptional regulator
MIDRPSGTVTFLFTDIAGSSQRWERNPTAMQATLRRHDAILRQTLAAHGGYVFKTGGDAFYAAFARAPDALSAALAAQQAILGDDWGAEGPLQVRMALHTGTPEERDGDYFGPPLNRAARLLSAAHGAQVLVSLASHELILGHLPPDVELRDLGVYQLFEFSTPERIFQITAPGLPAEFPPLRTLVAPHHNLPTPLTALVGREAQVQALRTLLQRDDIRLVTLTGPGGIGKTRLALQVGLDLLDKFPDGVFFVNLAPISQPDLVIPTIAATLGVREVAGQPLIESLHAYVRDRQMLLLLDNFEQVVDAALPVSALLEPAASVKVLVTSRAVLHLHNEQEFPVPALQLPRTQPLPELQALSQYEAVALFIQRARTVQPDFQVTNDNAPAVAEICARLDGLPLAIELAAVRIKLFSPPALLARLQHRLTLLTGGGRDRPVRQQTLQAAIDWSYDLLSTPEQRLFQRLAVFRGGATLDAITAVCNPDTTNLAPLVIDVLDGVISLMDKSLLRRHQPELGTADDEPRFSMLETIQEHAWARLAASGESAAVQAQHASYFLALAEEAEPLLKGATQERWLARLDAEHDNLRAALAWTQNEKHAESGLRLAGALWRFWYIRGYYSEGRAHLTAVLSRPGSVEPDVATPALTAARARAVHGAGVLAWGQGDYATAAAYSQESLALHQALNDPAGQANALNTLGLVARSQGDFPHARTLHTESLTLRRRLGDQWGVANALLNLGVVAWNQAAYAEARRLLEESLVLDRAMGDRWGSAVVLDNLGMVLRSQGDLPRARALLEESLAIRRALGDRWGIASALQHLAGVAQAQGNAEEAQVLLDESLALYRDVGDINSSALTLRDLAVLAADKDDYRGAWAWLAESLEIWQVGGTPAGIAQGLECAAWLAGRQGRLPQAARLWGAAEALREARGVPMPPVAHTVYDQAIAATRAQVDAATWAGAWAAGGALDPAAAVAEALDSAGTAAGAAAGAPAAPVSGAPETAAEHPSGEYPAGLSAREVAVLRLVAQGLTNIQVARELALSPHTVNVHLRSIYSKLDVPSRAAATRFAVDHKLL